MPRVLSIVSSHIGASVLMNSGTALWAFTSEEFFRHETGQAEADPNRYADLKNSVFLELMDGKIVPRRKEILAILLIAVDGAASTVFGMLHPEPEYPFSIEYLPDIPFLHVANWPASDNRLRFLWSVAHPSGLNVAHCQLARQLVRKQSTTGTFTLFLAAASARIRHLPESARTNLPWNEELSDQPTFPLRSQVHTPASRASDEGKPNNYATRFSVRTGSRVQIVSVNDVEWIAAAGDYSELHTSAGTHLLRQTMKSLEV